MLHGRAWILATLLTIPVLLPMVGAAPLAEPPVASFTFEPAVPYAHDEVQFFSTSHDPDGVILLQAWRIDGDDGAAPRIGEGTAHAFAAAGAYDVALRVVDAQGMESTIVRTVLVANAPPAAAINASATDALRGERIVFADASTDRDGDAIAQRAWDFGDGTTATGDAQVAHAYAHTGVYTVTLRVMDAAGNEAAAAVDVRVVNAPPVVGEIVVTPSPAVVGQPVTLVATATDPDAQPGDALSYRWTFTDGVVVDGATVERTFGAVGRYGATVVATDPEGGASAPASVVVDVEHARPVADFAWEPARPTVGDSVRFTDASTSAGGAITAWSWSFGDGATATGPNATHAYTAGGEVLARLTVTDENGRSASIERAIVVNARPSAAFDVSPSGPVRAGDVLSFNDASSDADGFVLAWHWDFGDGTTSNAQNPQHAYATPGARTVRLNVTDDAGATASYARTVTVENQAPIAQFSFSPERPIAGEPIAFADGSHDPDGTPIASWSWSFGDGTRATGATPSHVFAASGRHAVDLVVSDGLANGYNRSYVDVGADHALDVRVRALLPDGRVADLSEPHIVRSARLVRGSDAVALHVPAAPELAFTLARGEWQAGDALVLSVRDTRYMDAPLNISLRLHDAQTLLTHEFQLAMPLAPTLDVAPGERAFLGLGASRAHDGTPIHRDPTEALRGEGFVTLLDGAPVGGANVIIEIRRADVPSEWCRVAHALTDADGAFAWSTADDRGCAPGDILLPGLYEVRAVATYGFATSGASSAEKVWVDPTGGLLAAMR